MYIEVKASCYITEEEHKLLDAWRKELASFTGKEWPMQEMLNVCLRNGIVEAGRNAKEVGGYGASDSD